MDPRLTVTREDLYNVQMDLKQVQFIQQSHADRLLRLEKRQADDAAIKSAWNSPFPSVIGGTPQHGPAQMPSSDVFDDFDEQGQNLLGSLHLDADNEPVRRGAASRANSVRFDESALQGSAWGGQSGRQSGEFGPVRPSSGLGSQPMMERSLSHKSDGRHSSAGHSVHSVHSAHSAASASGRANSFGLESNFLLGGRGEDSPLPILDPPPSFFVLGSVPSIIRCWLTTNFAHNSLLYAAVCSGSQTSTVAASLLKELDLTDAVEKEPDGTCRVTLTVYLAEAVVTQSTARSPSLPPPMPCIDASFQVIGAEKPESDGQPGIRIFLGSDALRASSADILFSQNLMTLYSNDRTRVSVPFVRPEDDAVFKDLRTGTQRPEQPKLNANATAFVSNATALSSLAAPRGLDEASESRDAGDKDGGEGLLANNSGSSDDGVRLPEPSKAAESMEESGKQARDAAAEADTRDRDQAVASDGPRRESRGDIWNPWRSNASANGGEGGGLRESGLSGYQPASRGGRNMKVLKPAKSGSSSGSARTGAAYEPPPPPRSSGEYRRKSHASSSASGETSAPNSAVQASSGPGRWEAKRVVAGPVESAGSTAAGTPSDKTLTPGRDTRAASQSQANLPRSANPIGDASAFSWMTPATKPKVPAGGAE